MKEKIDIKAFIPLSNFKDYTFLMPSVSVGNVGQLAVDVLISTFKPTKVAMLNHPALLPIVGYDPYIMSSSDVATAADLYLCDVRKLLILQIRSPLIKEHKKSFLEQLASWIKERSFKDVIVLSSCHAHLRYDSQISGCQFRYLTTNGFQHPNIDNYLRENDIPELEEREDTFGNKHRNIPGAGFVYDFLDLCQVPAVTLMKFADDGDNTKDALALISCLNSWTKYQMTDKWEVPFSWKNLYGAPPPSCIY